MLKHHRLSVLAVAVCVCFLSACRNSQPPVIEIAAAMPCEVESGGTTSFSIAGNIPSGAEVHWEAPQGSFANPSSLASSYTAPEVDADTNVVITVNVIDGNDSYPRTLICKVVALPTQPVAMAEETEEPTPIPTEEPSPTPTEEPTSTPTEEPTEEATEETEEPTEEPTDEPLPWAGISFPSTGAAVGINIIVEGTYSDLPAGHSIWIAARPHATGRYYFQKGPATLSGGGWRNEAWIGSDEPGQSGQTFDIIVYIATPEAATEISTFLAECERNQNWPGQDSPPPGMIKYHTVTVTRQ